MKKKKIIFLPGLAADNRMFYKLKAEFPNDFYLNWPEPLGDESLPNYAERLAGGLSSEFDYFLVGASFGGIVALEMSKYLKPYGCLLIGSVSSPGQIPWLKRQLLKSFIINGLPQRSLSILPSSRVMERRLMGSKGKFISWAFKEISCWKKPDINFPLFHIHGTKDEVFPIKRVNPTKIIKGGSHNLLHSNPEVVSEYLRLLV